MTPNEATEHGRYRGEVHAAYADAYGGALVPEENEVAIPLGMSPVEASYYVAAFLEAAAMYEDSLED